MLNDLLKRYFYKINSLDWNNVILVPGVQEESIEDVYNKGYLNRKGRLERFSYNLDFEPVYRLMVIQYCLETIYCNKKK